MAGSTISINKIITFNESVISPVNTGIYLTSVGLSKNDLIPSNTILDFFSFESVQKYFGNSQESTDTELASVYFAGAKKKSQIPPKLSFYKVIDMPESGWILGKSLPTLSSLQSLGTQKYSFIVNCTNSQGVTTQYTIKDFEIGTEATSYSNLATSLQQAINAVVTDQTGEIIIEYISFQNCFKVTNGLIVGEGSLITAFTDPLPLPLDNLAGSAILGLNEINYSSIGSNEVSALNMVNNIVNITTNFASFVPMYQLTEDEALEIAEAVSSLEENYIFFANTQNNSALLPNDTTSLFPKILANGYKNFVPFWGSLKNNMLGAAVGAGLNLENSTLQSWLFQEQAGLTPDVTNTTYFDNLLQNGYNFYGNYSTRNPLEYAFYYKDNISGIYNRIDALYGAIWLKDKCQTSLIQLFLNSTKITYNIAGYEVIKSSLQANLELAIQNQIITVGITLSDDQKQQIIQDIGFDISNTLFNTGYYILVNNPPESVRVTGGSPIVKILYTWSGGISQVTISSIQIQ